MPIDLKGAHQKRDTGFPNGSAKLDIPEGIYQGDFIGMGTPFMTYDRFKGCTKCGEVVADNPKGPRKKGPGFTADGACVTCEGTGMLKVQEVALKYELETGEAIQEAMNYKLSAPATLQGGRVLSASKLFKRFEVFAGTSDPEEIVAWASQLPDDVHIPVTLIVKGEQYPKISDVMKRFAPRPKANKPVEGEGDEIPF